MDGLRSTSGSGRSPVARRKPLKTHDQTTVERRSRSRSAAGWLRENGNGQRTIIQSVVDWRKSPPKVKPKRARFEKGLPDSTLLLGCRQQKPKDLSWHGKLNRNEESFWHSHPDHRRYRFVWQPGGPSPVETDRKSTRLNSSH